MILSTLIPDRDWILCYNLSIGSMTQCFGKVEKRRSNYISSLKFIMNKIPVGEHVLRPYLINYKQVCEYVSMSRRKIQDLVNSKSFPEPKKFEGSNRNYFLTHEVELWGQGLWSKGGAK